jgi:hypothetical protein
LAGEAARNDIDGNSIGSKPCRGEFSNVIVAGHLGPVFRQNLPAEWFNFAEGNRFIAARALQTEREATDPAEEVEDAQLAHAATLTAPHCFSTATAASKP